MLSIVDLVNPRTTKSPAPSSTSAQLVAVRSSSSSCCAGGIITPRQPTSIWSIAPLKRTPVSSSEEVSVSFCSL